MPKEADNAEPAADFDVAKVGALNDVPGPQAADPADAQQLQAEPTPNIYVSPEQVGKLLFALDCAVRYTPQPQGGINMNEDIRPLVLQLGLLQQSL